MNKSDRARLIACVGLGIASVLAAGLSGCSRDSSTAVVGARAVSAPTLNAAQQSRLSHAMAQARWAGDAHHAAMQVVVSDIARHKKSKRRLPRAGSSDYCNTMIAAGTTALEALDRSRGIQRASDERRSIVRSDRRLRRCAPLLSVLAAPRGAWPPSSNLQATEPEVTGAYEAFLDPLQNAVLGSNGSVASVDAGVRIVLSQAIVAEIPDGDLLALASFAGVAISSAEEWNAFDWAGLGGGSTDGGDAIYSVFTSRQEYDSRALAVVGADVGGCISTVKGWRALKLLLVGPAWGALAGECGLRAALASGAAIWGLL